MLHFVLSCDHCLHKRQLSVKWVWSMVTCDQICMHGYLQLMPVVPFSIQGLILPFKTTFSCPRGKINSNFYLPYKSWIFPLFFWNLSNYVITIYLAYGTSMFLICSHTAVWHDRKYIIMTRILTSTVHCGGNFKSVFSYLDQLLDCLFGKSRVAFFLYSGICYIHWSWLNSTQLRERKCFLLAYDFYILCTSFAYNLCVLPFLLLFFL